MKRKNFTPTMNLYGNNAKNYKKQKEKNKFFSLLIEQTF